MICDKDVPMLQVLDHVIGNKHLKKQIAQTKLRESNEVQMRNQENELEVTINSEISETSESEPVKSQKVTPETSDTIEPPTSPNANIHKKKAKKVKKPLQTMLDELTAPLMEANRIVKARGGDESIYRCLLCGVAVGLAVVPQHIKGRTHLKEMSCTSKQVKRRFDENNRNNSKRLKTKCNDSRF
ncbi:hypothetical protein L1887_61371 [Cichorium endivia]|nr:hypothetical protein L1887_61371 [Cichorium endivia]